MARSVHVDASIHDYVDPEAHAATHNGLDTAVEETFPASDTEHFLPGREIEIRLGYRGDTESVFTGVVVKHSVRVRKNETRLDVELGDKAVRMTTVRRCRQFADMRDSDVLAELFAQHGFSGTSLRQVTALADVNIAAVNYHFGSKDNLVHEVFRRRMDAMSQQRLERLRAALDERPGELEPILAAFVEPALDLAQDRQGHAFIRVIARAYAENNDNLRGFLSDRYGHVQREFARALAARLPRLDKETLYWRLDFLGGALTYAMADFGLIKRPAGVGEVEHRRRAALELIRFAAAGFET